MSGTLPKPAEIGCGEVVEDPAKATIVEVDHTYAVAGDQEVGKADVSVDQAVALLAFIVSFETPLEESQSRVTALFLSPEPAMVSPVSIWQPRLAAGLATAVALRETG